MAREEAKNWYEGALIDLEESKSALLNKRLNWALFAAHQAVEKALKAAYIILKRKRGPKTHDLTRLASVFDFLADFRPIVSELSPYYTVARYPNAAFERPWEAISEETAKRLVEAAEAVVRRVGVELGFRSP
ncbi:MAG: HEPN domain-containing protein [Thaumarchaeota archaeon]|nr:HEPN domain-containing protein [Nitrososphaerota archaeon]